MSDSNERGGLPPLPVASQEEAPQPGRGLFNKIAQFFEDEEAGDDTAPLHDDTTPLQLKPSWYYWIFAASGFAGLIYESIWARYLKLFLGHAAYAQALVLAIFLLGLAVGAALCARFSHRLQRPLLYYAGIEVLVALTAVYFHDIFVVAQDWAIESVLPRIESDSAAELFKWGLAALLILPQSILLGATFPLMSAGMLRLWRAQRGRIIAMLYFSNSLGAVFGVLASGFVLLPFAGLSGTIAIAGLISTVAAAAVWALGHRFDDSGEPLAVASPARAAEPRLVALIMMVAFGTGLASFIYEIIWIRMLSLLMGSSTRTFEIVLAAFILGLALGGLAVRRRVDSSSGDLLLFLGKVQIVMGALALWSLFCFPWFYEILRDVLATIPRNDSGYWGYTALRMGLAALMLLPATFCAGMTLPLLTRRLLDGGGESAVGRVYAANTFGSIIGVFVALHVLLPLAGIQQGLLVGALVDMLLGMLLIGYVARPRLVLAVSFSVAVLVAGAFFGGINVQIAAAGVFRSQQGELPQVVFYRDGKTASIAITEFSQGDLPYPTRAIKTNGKSDASVFTGGTAAEEGYTVDEPTMVALGLIPLLYKPEAERIMNIGFGSGMTSRTLLLSPHLKQLDNVEIEPFIIEGARLMGSRMAPVFEDPRNNFIINDAKSVLARAPALYDVIVSEPSNPWVSGIANLFTKEFYQHVRTALVADGVFVQWLPLYETEPRLVASVAQALAEVFGNFNLYVSADNDIIFIASAGQLLPEPSNTIFTPEEARTFLSGYNYRSASDVNIQLIGNEQILMPYFQSFNAPTNSDYYPYLENKAPRAFFNNTRYSLDHVLTLPVPVLEFLGNPPRVGDIPPSRQSRLARKVAFAHRSYTSRRQEDGFIQTTLAALASQTCPARAGEPADEEASADEVADAVGAGVAGGEETVSDYLEKIHSLVSSLMPMLDKEQMAEIWRLLEQDECIKTLLASNDFAGVYTQFWRALSLRQGADMVETAELLLPHANLQSRSGQIFLLAAIAGYYQMGDYQRVVLLAVDMPLAFPEVHHAARLLSANAVEKL